MGLPEQFLLSMSFRTASAFRFSCPSSSVAAAGQDRDRDGERDLDEQAKTEDGDEFVRFRPTRCQYIPSELPLGACNIFPWVRPWSRGGLKKKANRSNRRGHEILHFQALLLSSRTFNFRLSKEYRTDLCLPIIQD